MAFGGFSIDRALLKKMLEIVPKGTVLEFGSGAGTKELAKFYTVFSVENEHRWVNKYNSTYIYAPIVNNWYDVEIIKREIPNDYDLILIDGPSGPTGRGGFCIHLDLFKHDIPMFFDDVHRKHDLDVLKCVSKKLNRSFQTIKSSHKKFGVIYKE